MTFFDTQNPGIGGLEELTPSEEVFVMNLNGLSYVKGDILYFDGTSLNRLAASTSGLVLKTNGPGTNPSWGSAGSTSPLTTKGDLYGFDTVGNRIPVGTDGQVLTADSTQPLGVKYATPSSSETTTSLGALIGSAGDATPNDTDFVATSLTAGGILKKITWTNTKAFLKTYFDTIYQAAGTYLTSANIVATITNGDTTHASSSDALFDALALKEPLKGADDNFVTDAQLVVIGNTSGTNTGDNATNSQYSGLAASKENTITGTTSADFWSGAKTFINFATTVRGTVLTGLSLATSQVIAATDTVLLALGYLQAQITALASTVASTYLPLAGGTMSGAITFAGYKAIAMACDNGTSFPATPSTAQWFYRTDIDTLFIYEAAWKAIISFGAVTLYVDSASGSDAVGQGYSATTGATATVQYAVNLIPPVNGGSVTINITAGTYTESVTIQGKAYSGNYGITLQGVFATERASSTVASAVQGVNGTTGGATGSVVVTGASMTTDQYKGMYITFDANTTTAALRGLSYTIWKNDNASNSTVTIVSSFAALPVAGDTFTIDKCGVTIIGYIAVADAQTAVTASKIKFTRTSPSSVQIVNVGAAGALTLSNCDIDGAGTTGNGCGATNGKIGLVSCWVHNCGTTNRVIVDGSGGTGSVSLCLIEGNSITVGVGIALQHDCNFGISTANVIQSCLAGINVKGGAVIRLFMGNTTPIMNYVSCGIAIRTVSGGRVSDYGNGTNTRLPTYTSCTNNQYITGNSKNMVTTTASTYSFAIDLAATAGTGGFTDVLVVNYAGTHTVTLQAALSASLNDNTYGREITIKTLTSNPVISATSVVVPIDSTTAGTAILPPIAGAWATLVSSADSSGTWKIVAQGRDPVAGRATAQTAANTSVATVTVGATDASYEVSANVLVTTATTHSFNVTVDYTDEGNTARTTTLNFSTIAGVISNAAITNAAGAVPYEGVPIHIRCKAATAITVKTAGTFTTVTYNVEGIIKLLK